MLHKQHRRKYTNDVLRGSFIKRQVPHFHLARYGLPIAYIVVVCSLLLERSPCEVAYQSLLGRPAGTYNPVEIRRASNQGRGGRGPVQKEGTAKISNLQGAPSIPPVVA